MKQRQQIRQLLENKECGLQAAVWGNNHKKAAKILEANNIINNFKQVYNCVEVAKQELQKIYH